MRGYKKMQKLHVWIILSALLTVTTGCWERKKVVVPEEGRSVIAIPSGYEDFDTYPGFRDWDRIPLKYPYQLHRIDGNPLCDLQRLSSPQGVTIFGNKTTILSDIEIIAPAKDFAAVEMSLEDIYQGDKKFAILSYESGECEFFLTEEEMFEHLKSQYNIAREELTFYTFNQLFQYFEEISFER